MRFAERKFISGYVHNNKLTAVHSVISQYIFFCVLFFLIQEDECDWKYSEWKDR